MTAALSHRSKDILGQPMFRILALANEIESAGNKVFRLEIGDTSLNADPHLLEELNQIQFAPKSLAYSPSLGEMELRQAFADKHNSLKGTEIGLENVAVTPANAAISQLMILLADPGDIVVLPDPCFATYRLAARFAQLNVIDAPLEGKSGYQFDTQELRKLFSVEARIKLMIIDSPSNPLGIAHGESEIQDLAAICLEFGVSLVVDETYRNLVYDESRRNTYDAQGVTWIYSLSKDAGAPGLRIGSVVGQPSVISKLGEFNSMFFSCLPKHIQLSAAKFLSSGKDSIEEIKSRYQGRLERATTLLSETKVLVPVVPNSSIYCFVDIGATGLSGEEFATQLLVSENVAVCPGLGFGPSGTSYIRISVSGGEEDLFEGLERIIRFAGSKS